MCILVKSAYPLAFLKQHLSERRMLMQSKSIEEKIREVAALGYVVFAANRTSAGAAPVTLKKADGTPLTTKDIVGVEKLMTGKLTGPFDIELSEKGIKVAPSETYIGGMISNPIMGEMVQGMKEITFNTGENQVTIMGPSIAKARVGSISTVNRVEDNKSFAVMSEDGVIAPSLYWDVWGNQTVFSMDKGTPSYEEGVMFDSLKNLFRASKNCPEVSRVYCDNIGKLKKHRIIEGGKPTFFMTPQDVDSIREAASKNFVTEDFLRGIEEGYNEIDDMLNKAKNGEISFKNKNIPHQLVDIMECCRDLGIKIADIPDIVKAKQEKIQNIVKEKKDEIISLAIKYDFAFSDDEDSDGGNIGTAPVDFRLSGTDRLLANAAYRLSYRGVSKDLEFPIDIPADEDAAASYIVRYILAIYSEDNVEFCYV